MLEGVGFRRDSVRFCSECVTEFFGERIGICVSAGNIPVVLEMCSEDVLGIWDVIQ